MSSVPLSFFDNLADRYDQTWTNTGIGRTQRNAVWRELNRFLRAGDRVLDLGCGTGEDALHLMANGAMVDAIDGSPRMVEVARRKGVGASLLCIEHIRELTGTYNLILSNFGALNCVEDVEALRAPLAGLIRPAGTLAICLMNRFCLWETVYYGLRGRLRKAARRWRGSADAAEGLRVFYPPVRHLAQAFQPDFQLIRDLGIGIAVPPSYVRNLPMSIVALAEKCDSRVASSGLGRAIGDHRLLIFERTR